MDLIFGELPKEIWDRILSFGLLTPDQLLSVGLVSHHFMNLSHSHFISTYPHLHNKSNHYLSKFTHLTTLTLQPHHPITDSSLSRLTNLNELIIDYPLGVNYFFAITARSLHRLTNLTKLNLKGFEVRDFLPLFPNLVSLTLEKAYAGGYIPTFTDKDLLLMTNLTELSTPGSRTLSAKSLGKMTKLRRLRCRRPYQDSGYQSVIDETLLQLTNLTCLEYDGMPDITEQSIRGLTKLEKLCFDQESVSNAILFLPSLTHLRFSHFINESIIMNQTNLRLLECCHYYQNYRFLSSLTNLTSLFLRFEDTAGLGDSLRQLTRLQSLQLRRHLSFRYRFNHFNTSFLFPDSFLNLRMLTFLALAGDRAVEGDPFLYLPHLTGLEVSVWGKNEFEVKHLSDLTKLQTLLCTGKIEGISDHSIQHLTNLEYLVLEETSCTPEALVTLKRLTTLTYLPTPARNISPHIANQLPLLAEVQLGPTFLIYGQSGWEHEPDYGYVRQDHLF